MSKVDKEIIHIHDPIFRKNFYYILAADQKELLRVMKDRLNITGKEKSGAEGLFSTAEKSGHMVVIIWTSNRNPWIIAHEVCHAVYWELDASGIQLTLETEEVYAYLTQFLFR